MVAVMIRMKLAMFRNSLQGDYLGRLFWSAMFGLAAVYFTYHFGVFGNGPVLVNREKLALLYGIWTIGWIFGPVLFSGEDKTLLPEHYRSVPISSGLLARGLLSASLFGMPAFVSLLAFVTLVVYAVQTGGIASAIVSIPAVLLQLLFVLAVSRVVTGLLRRLVRSQASSVLSNAVVGAIMAFFVTGWFLLALDFGQIAGELSGAVAFLLNAVPTNWAIQAVDAAEDGRWAHALGYLAGMALLVWLLLGAWAVLLRKRLTSSAGKPRLRVRRANRGSVFRLFAGPVGAVVRKERIAWSRDYTRSGFVYFALFYSVFLTAYPAVAGIPAGLPWTAALFVMTAAGATANLYGADGSALWMSLVAPRSERADVRGRQIAWLIVVAPVAFVLTVATVWIGGQGWSLPLALTSTFAALGGASGLVVLNSVYRLQPMIDAHKRGDDMFDHPLSGWQFITVMLALAILVAPPFALTLTGLRLGLEWLQWVGTAASIGFGVLYYRWLGRLAIKKLEKSGPELLHLMLHMNKATPADSVPDSANSADSAVKPTVEMIMMRLSVADQFRLIFCGWIGMIALIPQGLVPLVIKLQGGGERSWFLALYMPSRWQWPVIGIMVCGGLLAIGYAVSAFLAKKKEVLKEIADRSAKT